MRWRPASPHQITCMKQLTLSIPKPCHEDWNAMSSEDRGRFCGACQKTVVDFSNMSDGQVAQFFKEPAGRVCGRFHPDQLNRPVDIPKKRMPWVKHFFTILLPALFFSAKVSAQQKPRTMGRIAVVKRPVKKDAATTCLPPTESPKMLGEVAAIPTPEPQKRTHQIQGTVTDENNMPLIGATVMIAGTNNGSVVSDNGTFELSVETNERVSLEVSCVGYELTKVDATAGQPAKITMIEVVRELMGDVVVVKHTKKMPVEPKQPPVQKKVPATFSVYPNPIAASSSVTVNTEKLEAGAYLLSIANASGVVVQTETITVDKGRRAFVLPLRRLPAGAYVVTLVTKNLKQATYSQTLVIN